MDKLTTFTICVLILALGGCHHFGVRGDILGGALGGGAGAAVGGPLGGAIGGGVGAAVGGGHGSDGHDGSRKRRHSNDDD